MPAREIERTTPRIRGRAPAAPVLGFTLSLPEGLEEEPLASAATAAAPAFRAVERRPDDGRLRGQLDVSVITPNLIVDRDGVLVDTVSRVAGAMLAQPRDGYATTPYELMLPCGRAWRVDIVLRRESGAGAAPALPYLSALAVGHPDLRRSAALFVLVRAASDAWRAASEVLDSLRFHGAAARPSRRHVAFALTC